MDPWRILLIGAIVAGVVMLLVPGAEEIPGLEGGVQIEEGTYAWERAGQWAGDEAFTLWLVDSGYRVDSTAQGERGDHGEPRPRPRLEPDLLPGEGGGAGLRPHHRGETPHHPRVRPVPAGDHPGRAPRSPSSGPTRWGRGSLSTGTFRPTPAPRRRR